MRMKVQCREFLLLCARRPAFRIASMIASGTGSGIYARTARLPRMASVTLIAFVCSPVLIAFPFVSGEQSTTALGRDALLYVIRSDCDADH